MQFKSRGIYIMSYQWLRWFESVLQKLVCRTLVSRVTGLGSGTQCKAFRSWMLCPRKHTKAILKAVGWFHKPAFPQMVACPSVYFTMRKYHPTALPDAVTIALGCPACTSMNWTLFLINCRLRYSVKAMENRLKQWFCKQIQCFQIWIQTGTLWYKNQWQISCK